MAETLQHPREEPTVPVRLVLDRYRLERRLGAGGFGVVWQGYDEKLEREVAVKVMPREDGGDGRVAREARAAARLGHPGIVALYELASDDHDVYLVSELVRGRTLAELEGERALSDRDVARVGAALCDALDHAHARGVIHRDVKPQNVMVVADPAAGAGFAKLTDFGVAHLASGDPLTRTGDVVGTLAYMAPEQADGQRVTGACDVYSLALTLYEAWTGANPVRAKGAAATARRVGQPLPSLRTKRPDLPEDLCDAIDDALEPDPELRPMPAELAEDLRHLGGELSEDGGLIEPETLRRVGIEPDSRRAWRLHGRGFAARLGAGAAAGLLFLTGLALLGPEPPFSGYAAAGVVAALVALLPRVGWLASAAALCGWLASPEAGREGTALVLLVALAPVPLLLPRSGTLWSLPALAPLLGTIALAPAFVAVAAVAAGRAARRGRRRAALGAAGFLWLVAAEILTGRALLFGVAGGTAPRAGWEDSLGGALGDALAPAVTSPALAPVLAWAGFALLVPLVVRGRVLLFDALGAAAWAAGLILAHDALGDLLASSTALADARGVVAGPALGAVAAVALTALATRPEAGVPEPRRGGRALGREGAVSTTLGGL